jgi:hypothetical protein
VCQKLETAGGRGRPAVLHNGRDGHRAQASVAEVHMLELFRAIPGRCCSDQRGRLVTTPEVSMGLSVAQIGAPELSPVLMEGLECGRAPKDRGSNVCGHC